MEEMKMSKVNDTKLLKFGKTATRIIEVICWVGVALTLICAIAGIIDTAFLQNHLIADSGITFNGVQVATADGSHQFNMAAVLVALLGGCVALVLMALMFRNLYHVLASAETGSPFQQKNVERIERIGWLAIAMPVFGFVLATVFRLLGLEDVDISFSLTDLIMGILVLILSRFFAYGVSLQSDVDGMV